MRFSIKPTEDQINDVLNRAAHAEERGHSYYPGETYEAGVASALKWIFGDTPELPFDGDDGIEEDDDGDN